MAFAARVARAAAPALAVGRRFITVEAKAVRYHKHGHATNVLKVETVKLDTDAIKANQIFVRMLAAPITPSDLSQVAGFDGKAPSFPRTGGNEGVGVVEAVGSGVKGLAKGDTVVASLGGQGTWSTHVVGDADAWTKVEGSVGDAALPVEIAAVSVAAPVLGKLLVSGAFTGGAGVGQGDVLVQNGAMSTVGQAVVQYAAARGAKSINIMRQNNDWANSVYHLQGLGATQVVNEEYAGTPAFKALLADLPAPKLGLNCVGGAAATAVGAALGRGAAMVTYGSMSKQGVRAPSSWFTSKGLRLSGAHLDAYLRSLPKVERDAHVAGAVADLRDGKLSLLVAREKFADFPFALKRTLAPHERKVVLTF